MYIEKPKWDMGIVKELETTLDTGMYSSVCTAWYMNSDVSSGA